MPNTPMRAIASACKAAKNIPSFFVASHYLSKIHRRDEKFILCPYGIGDTLYVASLVAAYKTHHDIPSVKLIVKKGQEDIPDFFDAVDGKVVSNRMVRRLRAFDHRARVFEEGNYLHGHFVLDFAWPEPGRMLGVKGLSFIDIYKRLVLKLPMDAKLQLPKIMIPKARMDELTEAYGNKKTLLLMPYTVTVGESDRRIWESISERYLEKGYRLLTNVLPGQEAIQGSAGITLSIKETYVLANTLRWECIAQRSGLCDLFGFSDVKMTVVHGNPNSGAAWNMAGLGLPNPNMRDAILSGAGNISRDVAVILRKHERQVRKASGEERSRV